MIPLDVFRDWIEMEIVDGIGIKERRTKTGIGTCTKPEGETGVENGKEKATMQEDGIELSKIDRLNEVTTRLLLTEKK